MQELFLQVLLLIFDVLLLHFQELQLLLQLLQTHKKGVEERVRSC